MRLTSTKPYGQTTCSRQAQGTIIVGLFRTRCSFLPKKAGVLLEHLEKSTNSKTKRRNEATISGGENSEILSLVRDAVSMAKGNPNQNIEVEVLGFYLFIAQLMQ